MMSLKPEPVSAILFLPVKSDVHTVPPMTFDITGKLEIDAICLFICCVLTFFNKYITKINKVFLINKYFNNYF